jgi:transposase
MSAAVDHESLLARELDAARLAWRDMIRRCTNPKLKCFANYGGRGIRVADEWVGKGGFERFLAHVGSRPSPVFQLDRVDNDGHYVPGNVRWATPIEQLSNTRRNRIITFRGETLSAAQWARRTGIPRCVIYFRLKAGWSAERTLTEASRAGRRGTLTEAQVREIRRRRAAGETGALLAREFGISPQSVCDLVKCRKRGRLSDVDSRGQVVFAWGAGA